MVCTTSTQIHDSPSSRDPRRPSFANMLAALEARRCGGPAIVVWEARARRSRHGCKRACAGDVGEDGCVWVCAWPRAG
jgi:hypothetical protein